MARLPASKIHRLPHGAAQPDPARLAMAPEPRLAHGDGAGLYRALAYIAVCLPLVLLMVWARLDPDFNRHPVADWQRVLELAEGKRAAGDSAAARNLYSRAGRLAAWQDDWSGLLAAACGLQKIDKDSSPYSASRAFLLRAMMAAEAKQSREGLEAVARAFSALGAPESAAMARSRVSGKWPAQQESLTDDKSACR
jgi:hypothetical protein